MPRMHSQWKVKTLNNQTVEIAFANDPTLHLFPRVLPLHHSNAHSLGLTNIEPPVYRFPFCLDQKQHDNISHECCLDNIINAAFQQGLFISATNTWSTLKRHAAMQLRPLHLSLGPGLVRDTRSKFLLKLSWNILNQVELLSFMETCPNMAHIPPRLWKYTPPLRVKS